MAVPVSRALTCLAPQSAAAFRLQQGDILRIVAVEPEQVADIALFRGAAPEAFSPGRTIDYNERVDIRLGDTLYSNASTAMARVVEDTVGVHDLLLAPCSRAMFERRGEHEHPSCHENLSNALAQFGITPHDVTATLNVFMDVRVGSDRRIALYAPPSRAGDVFALEALEPLVVGLAACSSERTNAGRCKPIAYAIKAAL
jgi:uncharacterized protein